MQTVMVLFRVADRQVEGSERIFVSSQPYCVMQFITNPYCEIVCTKLQDVSLARADSIFDFVRPGGGLGWAAGLGRATRTLNSGLGTLTCVPGGVGG